MAERRERRSPPTWLVARCARRFWPATTPCPRIRRCGSRWNVNGAEAGEHFAQCREGDLVETIRCREREQDGDVGWDGRVPPWFEPFPPGGDRGLTPDFNDQPAAQTPRIVEDGYPRTPPGVLPDSTARDSSTDQCVPARDRRARRRRAAAVRADRARADEPPPRSPSRLSLSTRSRQMAVYPGAAMPAIARRTRRARSCGTPPTPSGRPSPPHGAGPRRKPLLQRRNRAGSGLRSPAQVHSLSGGSSHRHGRAQRCTAGAPTTHASKIHRSAQGLRQP